MWEGAGTSKHGTVENNPRNRYIYICGKEKEQVNHGTVENNPETAIYIWEGEGTSKHGTVENNPRNHFTRVKEKEI